MRLLPTIALHRSGPVLEARIDNPPSDLLSSAVISDLDRLGRFLRVDRAVRVLILTGPRPGVFIPHYDLSEIVAGAEELGLPTPYPLARTGLAAVAALRRVPGAAAVLRRTPASGLVELLGTHDTLSRLGRLPQVVIAAIDGDALGGGCEVALACDIRIMGEGDYRIGLPELSAGIPPGAGGTQRLARAVGPARALAMVLQSRTLTGDEAVAAGLVDAVVPDPLLHSRRIAETVGGWNPSAVRSIKRAMHPQGRSRGLMVEAAGFVESASGPAALDRLREFGAQPESPWRSRAWLPTTSARPPARPSP